MTRVFVIMACFALGGVPSETRSEQWTQFRGWDFMRMASAFACARAEPHALANMVNSSAARW